VRKKEGSGGILDTIIGGLMGDFREDPTLAEIEVNTAVSLIPVVGEVTAARDVTANIYFMVDKEEYTSFGRWFGLVLALISLFPEIGAALKGLGKAILKGVGEALGPIVRLMERVLEKLGHSDGIRNFFLKHWNAIVTKGLTLFEEVMTRLSSLLTDAVRFISSKAEAFAQGLKRVREAAAKALPGAIDKVKELFESVLERFGRKEEGQAAKTLEKEAEKTGTQLEKEGAAETEKAGAQATPGSVGAMRRYQYEASPKHGTAERMTQKGVSSRAPVHGQDALDNSVKIKDTSPRRVGIDYETGEFAVFDETHSPGQLSPQQTTGVYHGHVRTWEELDQQMKNALIRSGMVNRGGKIL
jgi:hypothetical protein